MDEVKLSITLLNQIMGYLGTRPYQEVFQLVTGVQQEVQAQAPVPPAPPAPPAD